MMVLFSQKRASGVKIPPTAQFLASRDVLQSLALHLETRAGIPFFAGISPRGLKLNRKH